MIYCCGPLHMDKQRQDDQLEPIFNSSVPIQNIALKTSQDRWTMETGGERGSGRSVFAVRHYDDDDDIYMNMHTYIHVCVCIFVLACARLCVI